MARKLVLPILLTLLLLSSCKTVEESRYLELAQNATTLSDKLEYYQTGLALYPSNIKYIYNTAYTLTLKKQYKEAEAILTTGIYQYPKAIYLYTLLAYCYKTDYKLYSYEKVMEKLLEIDPGFTEVREEMITHYWDFGKNDLAISHALSLYEFYPSNKTALNAIGRLQGGDFERYIDQESEKKAEVKTKPYLPPINISLEDIYYYLKSDDFLSRFLPSDHKAH